MERQILAAFAPGDVPAGLSLLASVPDGKATIVFVCGKGEKARALVARFEGGALRGDPVEVGEPMATCGELGLSKPFQTRSPGEPVRSTVVATWKARSISDASASASSAAVMVTTSPPTWAFSSSGVPRATI